MLAGIEAGGTKFACAVGPSPTEIRRKATLETETPAATFAACREFFTRAAAEFGALEAIGVAAFGPVGVDPARGDYGVIGRTPKPSWAGANFLAELAPLGAPVVVDTDVNGAGLGEALFGAGRGYASIAYVTVGTGVGAGVIAGGRPLVGARHYELGHIRPPHDRVRDPFAGACPYHGDCLEGLASGPAILARWGRDLSALGLAHAANDLEAEYIAHLMLTLTLAHAPARIIIGGGVVKAPGLLDKIRDKTRALIAGYVETPETDDAPYIVAPALGDEAGVTGALALAHIVERRARFSV